MKDRTKRENLIWLLTVLTLLGLSAVAVVRSLIIGLDIDEQYAVTLAYRIARGDILVKEVWEPHQTSALLPALPSAMWTHQREWCSGQGTTPLHQDFPTVPYAG